MYTFGIGFGESGKV